MYSQPGSSKYIKEDSYQKHFEEFVKNEHRYDEPLVIEEAKQEDSFSEREPIIEPRSQKHRSDSHQGFMNFTDFFKNIGKKKGAEFDSTHSTKEGMKSAENA